MKQAPLNLSKCKTSHELKILQIWDYKFLFWIFLAVILKKHCHMWNQHSQSIKTPSRIDLILTSDTFSFENFCVTHTFIRRYSYSFNLSFKIWNLKLHFTEIIAKFLITISAKFFYWIYQRKILVPIVTVLKNYFNFVPAHNFTFQNLLIFIH